MYNQAGFSEIGIPDLRAGLMRIHMTNQMFESGATSEQHVLMMAHSLSTARDSYFTKGTAEYNAGMAAIIDRQNMENPSDEVEDEMAQEAAQRRQELLQQHIHTARTLENKRLAALKSAKSIGVRCAVSSSLRNQVIMDILTFQVPAFSYLMVTIIPQNVGNRYQQELKWDESFFSYLTNSSSRIFDLALNEVWNYPSLHDFAVKVRKSLWILFNRQASALLQFNITLPGDKPVVEPGFCRKTFGRSTTTLASAKPHSTPKTARTELERDMDEILQPSPSPEDEPVAGPSSYIPRAKKRVCYR